MTRRAVSPFLSLPIALALLIACGDDVTVVPDDDASGGSNTGGAGASGGEGGSGGVVDTQSITAIHAPDERSVVVEFALPLDDAWMSLDNYVTASDHGALVVEGATLGADGRSVTLATQKQKLGVTYSLTYLGLSDDFLAADTARFWVTDLGSPNFTETEIVANRTDVGDQVVIYVEQGQTMGNSSAIRSFFESEVYPKETALLTDAPDRDDNGRVVLLGVDGKGAFGGYFSPVDTLPDAQVFAQWGIHSNEKEMLYLNTETGFLQGADTVVPHEFSHLLYQELHPNLSGDWAYHNEGLAECLVRAVNGQHDYALAVYVSDPLGDIADGISLVDWQYGNYSQYVQAFVFWSYIASQLDGVQTYADLMHLDGSPASIDTFVQQQLGKSFSETQLSMLIAARAQQSTGEYGFNGFISWSGNPPTASSGSLSLAPFTGVFIPALQSPVDVPSGQGPDIVMAGVDGAGNVDLTPPFDAAGGVVIALNSAFALTPQPPQPIGLHPGLPALASVPTVRDRAWQHPPPFHPAHLDRLRAWQKRTRVVE
ncbi:MAG: hypothetical protein KC766_36070 [Myxococcales bacterium]|nr:hypothetical protein [Myxococcales bacterium]